MVILSFIYNSHKGYCQWKPKSRTDIHVIPPSSSGSSLIWAVKLCPKYTSFTRKISIFLNCMKNFLIYTIYIFHNLPEMNGKSQSVTPRRFITCMAGHGSSIWSVSAWHASGPEFDLHVGHILSWRLGHEKLSTAILLLPLIQEEQLSVTGERICTKYW